MFLAESCESVVRFLRVVLTHRLRTAALGSPSWEREQNGGPAFLVHLSHLSVSTLSFLTVAWLLTSDSVTSHFSSEWCSVRRTWFWGLQWVDTPALQAILWVPAFLCADSYSFPVPSVDSFGVHPNLHVAHHFVFSFTLLLLLFWIVLVMGPEPCQASTLPLCCIPGLLAISSSHTDSSITLAAGDLLVIWGLS